MTAAARSTRREFLQGKAATDALVAISGGETCDALPASKSNNYLLKLSRRAMACQFEFYFNAGQYELANEAGLAALDLVDRLEDQLTIFRDHSEVSRVNRYAHEEPIAIDARLFDLLRQALAIHARTAGAYDITSGPLSRAWGFTRRAGAMPTRAELDAALACVGSQFIELDETASSVRFTRPGVEINLGSIGKGHALDCCGELLVAQGIGDFLLHGGNSSVLARGAFGSTAPEQGWSVGVRHPLVSGRRLGQLRLANRALATSGSGTQFFVHEDRRYGHLIDPRSGRPAEGVLTATVVAPTAAVADALATAFYIMGPKSAGKYCLENPEIAAVLLCAAESEGIFEEHIFGLDELDWTKVESA